MCFVAVSKSDKKLKHIITSISNRWVTFEKTGMCRELFDSLYLIKQAKGSDEIQVDCPNCEGRGYMMEKLENLKNYLKG